MVRFLQMLMVLLSFGECKDDATYPLRVCISGIAIFLFSFDTHGFWLIALEPNACF